MRARFLPVMQPAMVMQMPAAVQLTTSPASAPTVRAITWQATDCSSAISTECATSSETAAITSGQTGLALGRLGAGRVDDAPQAIAREDVGVAPCRVIHVCPPYSAARAAFAAGSIP